MKNDIGRELSIKDFPPGTECVYLVHGGDLWKIGFTTDLARRFASLKTMSPVPLTLEWAWLGSKENEIGLHQKFKKARHHGEWFDLSEERVINIKRRSTLPNRLIKPKLEGKMHTPRRVAIWRH